jgi:molybdopterin-guanine dinucleotide biosynthesis protein A
MLTPPDGEALFGSALILAGGKGRRLGYDKKELVIGGARVIDQLIEKLRGVFDEILVSSNTPFFYDGITTLKDEVGEGPLAGIYQGLRACKSAYLFVTACDMPFLSLEYVACLKTIANDPASPPFDVCAAQVCAAHTSATQRDDGFLQPFNALYHKNSLPHIHQALLRGEYKIQPLFQRLHVHRIANETLKRFDENRLFFNINHPEDLERGRCESPPG